ncbi:MULTISPECIES: hypothetical protein [Mycobacterium]|uniref:hypothetical protein n=1 Tax=Mycobacterium TaxID=1763 RepID=UPI000D9DAF08|nr:MULTISPECIES: hypothetical protein [Mycobacterium]SPX94920.1 Uncharacterised protein [Mycobacterium xenopi]
MGTADMIQTIHASHNEILYQVELYDVPDIAYLVRDDRLHVLTSTDGTIDFWFTHAPQLYVNRHATALLLATTRFSAHDVPLLRGNVVLAGHDSAGNIASLTNTQMSWLANSMPSWRDARILGRRVSHDVRARRQARASAEAAAFRGLLHPTDEPRGGRSL